VLISKDGGATYASSGVGGVSQSAFVLEDIVSLAGSWVIPPTEEGGYPSSVNGIATSKDCGDSWSFSKVPIGYTRYASYPSENVWYVSSGIWGSDTASDSVARHFSTDPKKQAANSLKPFHLSSKVSIYDNAFQYHEPIGVSARADTNTTGWFGTVSKTSDGGKTWWNVFNSDLYNDYYYFNSISCASESQCVVVAEGENAEGGDLAFAKYTTDGGASWSTSLFDETVPTNILSLMGSGWVSETEGWLGGTAMGSGRKLQGVFLKTQDGGKTYTLAQLLNDCFMIDMSIGRDGSGYAACSSSSGGSASVAVNL